MDLKKHIDQVLHGDVHAFEMIVRHFEKKIFSFCYFMLGNRQEAEDAAQEVFFRVPDMNSDLNIDRLIHNMKETKILDAEIAGKVMQKVHSFHGNQRVQKQQRFRISPIWTAVCVVLLISTASVSAAALLKTNWNGIQINISDYGESASQPAEKSDISYKEKLEAFLFKMSDVWETLSVDEAAKQFSYPLLRPQDSKFTLVKSFGAVLKDPNYRVKTVDEWVVGGFYDFFQWKQSDIVVRQYLNGHMTDSLRDPSKTLEINYGASWEYVEITDDILAMFEGEYGENFLLVSYRTADLNVITLEISGDLKKADMVALAKTYVEK
ncbi:sigma factor [Paenibacillus sp. 1011MAR3C5]|uniref:sigma factor n=1 Tax=Paenibacillus sp. 1011MAR3C5 TaxID=1675787 RepID=UPI001602FE22|nr:sigma factor [Paenibacillus sp. 1011MAR3C5]